MIDTLSYFVVDIKIPKTTVYNATWILVKRDGMGDGGIYNRTSTRSWQAEERLLRAMQGPDVTTNDNQQYTTHYSPLARLSMLIKLLTHIGFEEICMWQTVQIL